MDPEQRAMLVKRRAVIKGEPTRTQTYIENHENKFHELKVRRDKLADIWPKYETVQQELECYDDADHSADREQFENHYYYVQAKFSELLQQTVSPPRSRSNSDNEGQHNCSGGFNNSHVKLPTITLPTFSGKVCDWQHFRDTFQALIVDNKQLSDIQRYHYLISSLQGEAKSLIQNLPVTTENFHVSWQLVTDRYSNKK
jgi:hypothetical protein